MSSNATREFPSPVGGVPFDIDLAPSVTFATLYGLLVPIALWRIVSQKSRTYVLIGTALLGLEHVVSFALRAYTAHVAGARANLSLETYFQTTLNNGFISIGQDIVALTRALLVHATYGSDMLHHSHCKSLDQAGVESDGGQVPLTMQGAEPSGFQLLIIDGPGREDHPRTRFWIRRGCGAATILFLVSLILGIISGADYQNAVKSGAHAQLVQQLRYGSTALALFLLVGLGLGAAWACFAMPRVPKRSAVWIVVVTTLLSIIGIYRLAVMRYSTTSLFSTAPGSLNSSTSKALFYALHVAPEYAAAAILMCLNARRVFSSGLLGDRRLKDPEPRARA
ncbi:hypothetical protein C8Q80DRAFT_496442 [Daedaleopsis nitida]|nr:hypothetical protein C8Q80DRAFT_496442 [Daedaleopsis nitida]